MEILTNVTILLFLASCAYFDLKSKQIPLLLLYAFGLIIGGICWWNGYFNEGGFFLRIMPGALFIIIAFVTKQALGYGDGAVILLLGLLLDFKTILTFLVIALLFSAIVSLLLLLFKKGNAQTKLPFLPFLLSAWGVILIWY
jgi:leader peptidase (prepilin peptidase)/N-methyltransferase